MCRINTKCDHIPLKPLSVGHKIYPYGGSGMGIGIGKGIGISEYLSYI